MNRILLLMLMYALVAACATSPTGRSQLMLISPQAAVVESKKAYLSTVSELDKKNKLVNDPALAKRVATITGRLVTVAIAKFPETANWEWSVAIIDEPKVVNAWCMAGGRMAVYTGLFNKLQLTDSEFAQIMGHEISHALANHTAEQMSRAMATTLGVVAVGAMADKPGIAMGGAAMAAKVALDLPNSRTAEREADEIGMQLAVLAGYDPDAAVSLWEKMAAQGGANPPQFLSTHPAPGNRQETLAAMIPAMRQLNPTGKLAAVHKVQIVQ
jgi:predicted Zn-dependent protease